MFPPDFQIEYMGGIQQGDQGWTGTSFCDFRTASISTTIQYTGLTVRYITLFCLYPKAIIVTYYVLKS